MNKKEVLSTIRVLLGLEKFADATLVDGTKVTNDMSDELAEGQKLYVIDAEGNKVDAPEGEHTTDSGITVTVDAEGIITGIARPDEGAEGSLEAKKDKMMDDAKKEKMMDSPGEKLLEVAENVAELGLTPEAVLEMVAPIVEEVAALKDEVATMKKAFEDYKNGPAAEKMSKRFNKFSQNTTSPEDAYARIAKIKAEMHGKK